MSLSSYTYKVQKQVHPDMGSNKDYKEVMDNVLMELAGRIAVEIERFTRENGKKEKQVTSRSVQTAVRLLLTGELAKMAVSEATKAVTRFSSNEKGTRDSPKTIAKRAGIVFPAARMHTFLKDKGFRSVSKTASVYLAAVLEMVSAEIHELAGNVAKDHNKVRATPRHLKLAIDGDKELKELFRNSSFKSGGVTPHIHEALLEKGHAGGES